MIENILDWISCAGDINLPHTPFPHDSHRLKKYLYKPKQSHEDFLYKFKKRSKFE
jgi:hypothetical protein